MQLRNKCFCVQISGKMAKKREKFAPRFGVPCALLVKRFVGGIENVKSGSRKSIMLGRPGNEISALWTRRDRNIEAERAFLARLFRHARAAAPSAAVAIFVVALTPQKNNRHWGWLRFHRRASPQLFAVYTMTLRPNACVRVCVADVHAWTAWTRSINRRYLIFVTEKSRDYLETFKLPEVENSWNSSWRVGAPVRAM